MSLPELASLSERLFAWTWRTSLDASVVIGLVFLLQRLFQKQLCARSGYLLSWLVLVRLVLPALPASAWSPWNARPWQGQARQDVSTRARPTPLNEDAGALDVPILINPAPVVASSPSNAVGAPVPRSVPWRLWLRVSWILGVIGALGSVAWQHRRFARWKKRQEPLTEPALLALLERSKKLMGVPQCVGLIATEEGTVPMLYGWRRPVLVIPVSTLASLEDRELAMVMLHELAHVKRRDILLNWVMILVQSWHWFNPLVWLALRRLRADRELVCDEMVLRVLSPEEGRVYGNTLVKLLDGFAGAALSPSLVPVINNKHEIKRRIIMISKFTPTTRTGWILTSALVLLVGWLTFTRGADQAKPAPASPTTLPESAPLSGPPVLQPPPASPSQSPLRPDREKARALELHRLEGSLARLDQRILLKQAEVDRLRREAGGIPNMGADAFDNPTLEPETLRMFERERISMVARAASFENLYNTLKPKSLAELAQAIPTALPDTELSQLLRDLNAAEASHAKLVQEFGTDQISVRQSSTMIMTVRTQIQTRVEGILTGLKAQMASQMASAAALSNEVQAAKIRDTQTAEKYRPYFIAKRDLDRLQKVREALLLKILTKQYDAEEAETQ